MHISRKLYVTPAIIVSMSNSKSMTNSMGDNLDKQNMANSPHFVNHFLANSLTMDIS